MKKIVLFSIVLFFQIALFGQKGFESLGVLAGGNLYKKSPNPSNDNTFGASPNVLSGIFTSFRFNKRLGLLAELNYSLKREVFFFRDVRFFKTFSAKHYYISMPLQLEYFPFSKEGFSLTTGLEPAYLTRLQFVPSNGSNPNNLDLKNQKRLDMVANLGLRYDWGKIFLALRFSRSLMEINKFIITDENGSALNGGKQFFQGFQLYVGMALLEKSDL